MCDLFLAQHWLIYLQNLHLEALEVFGQSIPEPPLSWAGCQYNQVDSEINQVQHRMIHNNQQSVSGDMPKGSVLTSVHSTFMSDLAEDIDCY